MTTDYALNITAAYLFATDDEIDNGLAWYRNAYDIALALSPHDVWRGAGVIAALSPMKEWNLNIRLAEKAFETGIVTGNVGQHNAKAQRILDGEYALDVLNGPKTRSFCEAIATAGHGRVATIDRHAHDVAMGVVHTDATRRINKSTYNAMADAYAEVAYLTGIGINALQAITWVAWKRRKGETR